MKRPNAYATARGSEKRKLEANRTWVLLLIGSHSDTPWTNPRSTANSGSPKRPTICDICRNQNDASLGQTILDCLRFSRSLGTGRSSVIGGDYFFEKLIEQPCSPRSFPWNPSSRVSAAFL